MHPLVDNLESLKDSDIERRIGDLTRKYFMTHNFQLQQQISLMLDTYKDEINQRRAAELEKTMKSKELDKLININ